MKANLNFCLIIIGIVINIIVMIIVSSVFSPGALPRFAGSPSAPLPGKIILINVSTRERKSPYYELKTLTSYFKKIIMDFLFGFHMYPLSVISALTEKH